jgi:hypothetical protein
MPLPALDSLSGNRPGSADETHDRRKASPLRLIVDRGACELALGPGSVLDIPVRIDGDVVRVKHYYT